MRFRKGARWVALALVFVVSVAAGALVVLRVAAAVRETASAETIAPKTGRFVATAAGRIYIVENGPVGRVPVLLFHGTAGWSALWAETQRQLAAAGFRSIAFDIPPFGFSDKAADGKYDRTSQAARVVALLDALAIDHAVLVGHSYGGGPAAEVVLRAPERVAGLVLLDAALGLDTEPADPPAVLKVPFLREVILSATATNPLATRWLLSTLLARKEAATADTARMLQLPMTIRGTTPSMGRWAESFMGFDAGALSSKPASYGAISVPTMIVWGDADTVTPLAQGRQLAAIIPDARLEIIPGVGHIPHLEDPALAIPVIVRAVEKVSGGSRPPQSG